MLSDMRKILITTILVNLSLLPAKGHAAFEACRDYFPTKQPPEVTNRAKLRDICFSSFAVLHSGESKTPVYTVQRLNRAQVLDAKGEARTDRFYEEARLPSSDRASLDDYRGSGYDRGHQAPAGDMPTPSAMAQSFSLANMVPQSPQNNRGIWARRVEAATRHYALRAQGDVFVFTGPAYANGRPAETIGRGHVWVPTHLFKLVYDPNVGRAWAYWVENRDGAKMGKPISYRQLVNHIGIDLLPRLHLKE